MRFFFFLISFIDENNALSKQNILSETNTLAERALSLVNNFSEKEVEIFSNNIVFEKLENINNEEKYRDQIDYYVYLLRAAELLLKLQKNPELKQGIGTLSVLASYGGLLGELIVHQTSLMNINLNEKIHDSDVF